MQPQHLAGAALDMRQLSASVTTAYQYASANVVSGSGGTVYDAIAGEVDSVREDMLAAYGWNGQAHQLFLGGADTLEALAGDYVSVDEAQAAKYDALLPDATRVTLEQHDWSPDEVGIDHETLTSGISGSPADGFEDFEQFASINDTIDGILGFDWLGGALGKVGIDFNLIDLIEEQFGGDWKLIGTAVGAMEGIESFWTTVSNELQGVVGRFEGSWTGEASDAATVWFADLQEACFDHGKAIGKSVSRIKAESFAFIDALTALEKALDSVAAGLGTDDSGLGIGDLLGTALDLLKGKLLGLVNAAWSAWILAKSAGQAVVAAFSQLTRFYDTEWPHVPAWSAPDVNGSAA